MSGSDSWASAPTLAAAGSTTIDNTGFTSEASEPIPSEGPGDGPWQSVWWKWVAPSADPAVFHTQGSRHADATGMDTVLAVYTGTSLAGLTEIVANDDYGPYTGLDNLCSRVAFTPVAGTTYYIQASGYDNTEFGDLHLTWLQPASTPPTITAPAGGTTYTPDDDIDITLTWTPSTLEHQVTAAGAVTYDSGVLATGATSHDIPVPYPSSGSLVLSVRRRASGEAWSPWATTTVTITPDVDTPVTCIDDEIITDSPLAAYLFRDASVDVVTDASGNTNDAAWNYLDALILNEGGDLGLSTLQNSSPTYPAVRSADTELMPRTGDTGTGGHAFDFTAAEAGDLLVLAGCVHANYATPPSITISDPGFTIELDAAIGDVWFFVARKIATGSEATVLMSYSGMPRAALGEIPGSGVFVNAYGASAIFDASTYAGYSWSLQTETSSVDGPVPGFTTSDPKSRLFFLVLAGSDNRDGMWLVPNQIMETNLGFSGAGTESSSETFVSDGQEAPFGISLQSGRWFAEGAEPDGRYQPYDNSLPGDWAHAGPRVGLTIVLTPNSAYTGTPLAVPKGTIFDGAHLYFAIAANLGHGANQHFADMDRAPSQLTGPSGWTRVAEATHLGTRWEVWHKDVVSASGDPTSWTWTGDPDEVIGSWQHWRFWRTTPADSVALNAGDMASIAAEAFPDDPDLLRAIFSYGWDSPGDPAGTIGTWSPPAERTSGSQDEWTFSAGESADRTLTGGTSPSGAIVDFLRLVDMFPVVQQTPAPVCDAGCADDNFFVAAPPGGTQLFGDMGGSWTADAFTVEYVARVRNVDPSFVTAEIVDLASSTISNDMTDGRVDLNVFAAAPVSESDFVDAVSRAGCWVHVVHELADGRMQTFVNAVRVSDEAVGALADIADAQLRLAATAADIALLAVYDQALTRPRITAHFSHLCGLCREGGGFRLGVVAFSS